MADEQKWPGYTGKCHPEVWNYLAKPRQPVEKKVGQLTEEQVNEYFEQVSLRVQLTTSLILLRKSAV